LVRTWTYGLGYGPTNYTHHDSCAGVPWSYSRYNILCTGIKIACSQALFFYPDYMHPTSYGKLLHLVYSQNCLLDWQRWCFVTSSGVDFTFLVWLNAVLCAHLGGDKDRIRKSIVLGSMVPLVMFLLWDAVALCLMPVSGSQDSVDVLVRCSLLLQPSCCNCFGWRWIWQSTGAV
jgi:hypothetical protein